MSSNPPMVIREDLPSASQRCHKRRAVSRLGFTRSPHALARVRSIRHQGLARLTTGTHNHSAVEQQRRARVTPLRNARSRFRHEVVRPKEFPCREVERVQPSGRAQRKNLASHDRGRGPRANPADRISITRRVVMRPEQATVVNVVTGDPLLTVFLLLRQSAVAHHHKARPTEPHLDSPERLRRMRGPIGIELRPEEYGGTIPSEELREIRSIAGCHRNARGVRHGSDHSSRGSPRFRPAELPDRYEITADAANPKDRYAQRQRGQATQGHSESQSHPCSRKNRPPNQEQCNRSQHDSRRGQVALLKGQIIAPPHDGDRRRCQSEDQPSGPPAEAMRSMGRGSGKWRGHFSQRELSTA